MLRVLIVIVFAPFVIFVLAVIVPVVQDLTSFDKVVKPDGAKTRNTFMVKMKCYGALLKSGGAADP